MRRRSRVAFRKIKRRHLSEFVIAAFRQEVARIIELRGKNDGLLLASQALSKFGLKMLLGGSLPDAKLNPQERWVVARAAATVIKEIRAEDAAERGDQ